MKIKNAFLKLGKIGRGGGVLRSWLVGSSVVAWLAFLMQGVTFYHDRWPYRDHLRAAVLSIGNDSLSSLDISSEFILINDGNRSVALANVLIYLSSDPSFRGGAIFSADSFQSEVLEPGEMSARWATFSLRADNLIPMTYIGLVFQTIDADGLWHSKFIPSGHISMNEKFIIVKKTSLTPIVVDLIPSLETNAVYFSLKDHPQGRHP